MNINWSSRKEVINLAQSIANRGHPQIVYKVKQRSNYNICSQECWIRRLAEFERQGMVVMFVLTVDTAPALAPIIECTAPSVVPCQCPKHRLG